VEHSGNTLVGDYATLKLSGTVKNTGNTTVEQGTLNVANANGGKGVTLYNLESSSAGSVQYGSNALTLAGNNDTTISGLAGTADVTKTGTGTTTLANNSVGTFVQEKGNVVLDGTLTGNYKQKAGKFVTKNNAAITGNAEFQGNLEIDLNENDSYGITVGGNVKIENAGLNIKHWKAGTTQTYNLFSAHSVTGMFGSNITFDNLTANNRQGYNIVTSSDTKKTDLTVFTNKLAVTRDAGGKWSDSNWNVSADKKFYSGDYVTFNSSGSQNMTLDSNVETAGMKIAGGQWSFSGNKITGAAQNGLEAAKLTPATNDGKLVVTGDGTSASFNNSLQFTGISVTDKAELSLTGNGTVQTGTLITDKDTKLNIQAVSGKVKAAGDVTINGNVNFVYSDDPRTNETIKNVITTADGTINAENVTFNKLLSSSKTEIANNGKELNIIIQDVQTISEYAVNAIDPNKLSNNLLQIAQLIGSQEYTESELLQQLYGLGAGESKEIVQILVNQLGPELAANASQLSLAQPNNSKVFNRLQNVTSLSGGFLGQNPNRKYELWFEGFYRHENITFNSLSGNYKSSRSGVLTGIESWLCQPLRAGLFFGYSNPRISSNLGHVDADDLNFGVYSNVQLGYNIFMSASLGYGLQTYQYSHNNSKVNYNGNAFYTSLELFRPMLQKSILQLTPLIAIDFQKAWTDQFITPDTRQIVAKNSLDQISLRFGLNSKFQPTDLLNFRTRLQYGVQVGGDLYGSVKTSFSTSPTKTGTLTGVNLGRNKFNIGIGSDVYTSISKRTKLFADYDLEFGKHSIAHTGQFRLVTQW
jgi:hypothetical protein